MAAVKLHFTDAGYLKILIADENFQNAINYLNPELIDDKSIALYDPIKEHDPLDTEIVVLSMFARAIKNLIFPLTNHPIEFLNPILGQQKGGLRHDQTIIIDSTDVEAFEIT